jgi:Domain of unknown function (DUF4760)
MEVSMNWDCIRWWAEEVAKIAPIGTMLIALTATIIARLAICAQRDIARKRAAIDFVLKLIADHMIIALRTDLSERVERLKVAENWHQDGLSDDFHRVVTVVNMFEAMAAGVNTKVLDEEVCYRILGPETVDIFGGADVLLQRLVKSPYSPTAVVELRKLVKKWKKRAD